MATDITGDTSSIHDVQVARLDADMFSADDIDGGTEGLAGSGNLNYLVLQSQQTNEAARNTSPFDFYSSNYDVPGGQEVFPGGNIPGDRGDSRAINPSDFTNSANSSGFLGISSNHNGDNHFFNASESSNSALNTATHSFSSYSATSSSSEMSNNYFPGDDGIDGNNGNNGNGLNGSNGDNGIGHDGKTPTIPVDPPVDSHIGVHVISDLLTANVDELINPIGDLVGGINLDVTGTLGNILSPTDGLLPHPGTIIDGIISDNHIINDMHLGPILEGTEHLVDGVVETVNPVLTSLLPFTPDILNTVGDVLNHLNGDSGLFVTSNLGLPDIAGMSGIGNLALHVPLTPVEAILGDMNIHLSLDSDQTHLLTDGLQLQPIDIGLVSTGDLLHGLDTGISTSDLLGSTADAIQDVVNNIVGGNLLTTNLDDIPGNLTNAVSDLASPVTDILHDIGGGNILGAPDLSSISDLLNTLPGSDALAPVTDGLNYVLGNSGGGVPDISHFLDPVTSLAGDTASSLTDSLSNVLPNPGDGLPDTAHLLDPVTNLAGNLTDGNGIGDLLNGHSDGGSGTDTDLTINTPLGNLDPAVTLDPVENIAGDIDLGVNLDTQAVHSLLNGDVAGAIQAIPDTLENLVSVGIAPLTPEQGQDAGLSAIAHNTDTRGSDTDIAIQTPISNLDPAITLDPVENIVGDVDVGVNLNQDTVTHALGDLSNGSVNSLIDTVGNTVNVDVSLLNPAPDQNAGLGVSLGNATSGIGDLLSNIVPATTPSWPEATIGSAVDSLTHTADSGAGIPATLPDPVGVLTDGLNLIHDTSSHASGALGGLTGGHHGGLFG